MRGLQRPSHRRRGCPKPSPEIRDQQSQDHGAQVPVADGPPTAYVASVSDAGRTHGQVGRLKGPGLHGGRQARVLTLSPSVGR